MRRQGGFSIIVVIFLLVVLAGLGAVIAQLSATQHLGIVMALEGRQGWYAARSGLEWGRGHLAGGGACLASTTFAVAGHQVTVSCSGPTVVTEGDASASIYRLVSTARRTGVAPGVESTREAQMSIWITH
jgi:MSHA biogenesis protein MshP